MTHPAQIPKSNTQEGLAPQAVIYARVSSARQVEEGHGLDSQAARCADYAARKGYEVIETFHEKGVSGGDYDRPTFNRLIAFISAEGRGNTIVIIDDISRLARDIEAHWMLRRTVRDLGGTLESPSINFGDDPDSILIENLLASVSQHQRQKNAEQTRNRMRARALNGYYCFGGKPRGYRYGKVQGHGNMLVRDEPLATIIAEALEGYASGRCQGQAELKAFLEDQPAYVARYPNGKVRYEEINRLLNRPIYAGYIFAPSLNSPLFKGHHEPLISLDTYNRIQTRLKEGARVPFRKDLDRDFPLRGFVTCAECDGPLTSCWSKSKTGKKHAYYMCFQKGCDSYRKSIRKADIEGAFATLLRALTPSAGLSAAARAMFADIWDLRIARAKHTATSFAAQIAQLEKDTDLLVDKLIGTNVAAAVTAIERKIANLEARKLLLQENAAKIIQPARPFEQMFELAMPFLSSLWKIGRYELQRTVLN